jgi:transcriptional regulator
MHNPASFRENSIEAMHDLLRANPLGMLITQGPQGLQASPIPFLLYTEDQTNGTLRAHMARANPQWRELDATDECLIIFQGTQGYVTPSWYPGKQENPKQVPTWNYATVHAWGKARVIEDIGWLERQLSDLTYAQERQRPQPWAVTDAPRDYIATQMKAIIGFEIPIERIEGKWKMSQNKSDSDRQGVIAGMRAEQDPHRNLAVAEDIENSNKG